MSKRSSTNLKSFTLIEVLAGLMLLGTLLVSLILARSNLIEQQLRAHRTLEAVQLAEALLAFWTHSASLDDDGQVFAEGLSWAGIPANDQGRVIDVLKDDLLLVGNGSRGNGTESHTEEFDDYVWRTRTSSPRHLDDSWSDRIDVLRLELYDRSPGSNPDPLVTVELLLPAERVPVAYGGSHP